MNIERLQANRGWVLIIFNNVQLKLRHLLVFCWRDWPLLEHGVSQFAGPTANAKIKNYVGERARLHERQKERKRENIRLRISSCHWKTLLNILLPPRTLSQSYGYCQQTNLARVGGYSLNKLLPGTDTIRHRTTYCLPIPYSAHTTREPTTKPTTTSWNALKAPHPQHAFHSFRGWQGDCKASGAQIIQQDPGRRSSSSIYCLPKSIEMAIHRPPRSSCSLQRSRGEYLLDQAGRRFSELKEKYTGRGSWDKKADL